MGLRARARIYKQAKKKKRLSAGSSCPQPAGSGESPQAPFLSNFFNFLKTHFFRLQVELEVKKKSKKKVPSLLFRKTPSKLPLSWHRQLSLRAKERITLLFV